MIGSVLALWVHNPYFQLFCGDEFMQHDPPVDPSSLSRWRKTLGKADVSWLLAATIEAGEQAGLVRRRSFDQVIVDTTVKYKDIALPLDGELCDKAHKHLLKLARKGGIRPMRTYARLFRDLHSMVCRLGCGRKFKLMNGVPVELRRFTEWVAADIRRQLALVHCPASASGSSRSTP